MLALSLLLSLAISQAPQGGAASDPELLTAKSQLRSFEENKALETLARARAKATDPVHLSYIQLYSGLAYAQLNQFSVAERSFEAALTLNHDVHFADDDDISPKVAELFAKVKARIAPEPPKEVVAEKPPEVKAPPPELTAPPPAPQPSVKIGRKIAIGVLCVAALAAGAGAYMGLQSREQSQNAQGVHLLSDAHTAQASAVSDAHAANALFVTAGVLGVGGGIVLAVDF